MNENALAKWLAVYDKNMPRANDGGRGYAGGMSPWGTMVGRDDDANYGGGRLLWAMSQAQDEAGPSRRERPNFFADDPSMATPAYAQPERFAGTMPQRKPMQDPMRARTQNYLLNFLGR